MFDIIRIPRKSLLYLGQFVCSTELYIKNCFIGKEDRPDDIIIKCKGWRNKRKLFSVLSRSNYVSQLRLKSCKKTLENLIDFNNSSPEVLVYFYLLSRIGFKNNIVLSENVENQLLEFFKDIKNNGYEYDFDLESMKQYVFRELDKSLIVKIAKGESVLNEIYRIYEMKALAKVYLNDDRLMQKLKEIEEESEK